MEIRFLDGFVEIEGYVNAIERNSRILQSRIGNFTERICKGAFDNAIKRNGDIHILLNHDWQRDLGSTKQGNLELCEDAIGLKARATVTDPEVIKSAKNGDLVGWSFGFKDREVEQKTVDGVLERAVKDLDLFEVSILDRTRQPAYEGTLITARSDSGEVQQLGVEFIDAVTIREEKPIGNPQSAENSEPKKDPQQEYFSNLLNEIKLMEGQ